jgi:hypothetical protein
MLRRSASLERGSKALSAAETAPNAAAQSPPFGGRWTMIRDAPARGKRRISARKILTCRSEKRKLLPSKRLPRFPALCNGNGSGEIYTFSAPPGRAARDERRATMKRAVQTILQGKLRDDNYGKLVRLQNPKLNELLADAITLCEPESVFVCADSEE